MLNDELEQQSSSVNNKPELIMPQMDAGGNLNIQEIEDIEVGEFGAD